MTKSLRLRTRRSTYIVILGVVSAMLAAGLAIPFVFGTRLSSTLSVAPPLATVPTGGNTSAVASSGGGLAGTSGGSGPAGFGAGNGNGLAAAGFGAGTGVGAGAGVGVGGPGGASGTATGLTSTDKGVTATTVSVAFVLADLGGLSKLGVSIPGYDVQTQEQDDGTFVDYVNRHGGLSGRTIVPVYVTYNPLDESSEEAACLTATQDHTIFAAIDSGGGLSFTAQLCFTQQNRTPLIELGSFGTPAEIYADSAGYLFTSEESGLRSLANTAWMLAGAGAFKNKKIGIVDRQFEGTVDTVTDGMIDVLQQLGYSVTYRVDMSTDDETAASQVPVAVEEMQAHGVTEVMLLTDFLTGSEFAQSADKSAYHPLYVASDFESMTTDVSVEAMPSSFEAVGVTTARTGEWRVGIPEPAVDASCREEFAAATGMNLARSSTAYEAMLESCGLVELLALGGRGAGTDLTRTRFSGALQQVGTIPYPYTGGFSYRPGKYDGADPVRLLLYTQSCTCWIPKGSFVAPKY